MAQKLFESVHRKELIDLNEAWLAVAEEGLTASRAGHDQGIDEEDFFTRVRRTGD